MRYSLLTGAGLMAAGCASLGAQSAVLEPGALPVVTAALEEALGRKSLEFGPSDPTEVSQIVVLPPRLAPAEDRSLATPEIFVIIKDGENCVLYSGKRDPINFDGSLCRVIEE